MNPLVQIRIYDGQGTKLRRLYSSWRNSDLSPFVFCSLEPIKRASRKRTRPFSSLALARPHDDATLELPRAETWAFGPSLMVQRIEWSIQSLLLSGYIALGCLRRPTHFEV